MFLSYMLQISDVLFDIVCHLIKFVEILKWMKIIFWPCTSEDTFHYCNCLWEKFEVHESIVLSGKIFFFLLTQQWQKFHSQLYCSLNTRFKNIYFFVILSSDWLGNVLRDNDNIYCSYFLFTLPIVFLFLPLLIYFFAWFFFKHLLFYVIFDLMASHVYVRTYMYGFLYCFLLLFMPYTW